MVTPAHDGSPPGSSPRNQYGATENRETAPIGITILCAIGALVALFGPFTSVRITGAGGPFTSLGFLFLVLFVGYGIVLYGLRTVQPWGWTWGMIVFGIDALHDLVTLEFIGLIVSLVPMAYLYSEKDLYR